MASWMSSIPETQDLDLSSRSNESFHGRKVSTSSVMECLKWTAGEYKVVVEEAALIPDTCICLSDEGSLLTIVMINHINTYLLYIYIYIYIVNNYMGGC